MLLLRLEVRVRVKDIYNKIYLCRVDIKVKDIYYKKYKVDIEIRV